MAGASANRLDDPPSQPRIERLAAVLVAAGRVAPALDTEGAGGLVARWWPLPAPEDRPWLEALLPNDEPASQRRLAEALAAAVDRLVRQRLRALPGAQESTPKPTPATAPLAQAWLTALAADDSRLPAPLAATAGASGEQVASWVRQAVAPGGDLRLALRCHEPADGRRRRWTIELLLGPPADPSLLLPLADFWAGGTPFPAAAFEAVLQQLGLLTRLAPELAALLQQAAPAQLELEEAGLVSLVSGRAALLAEAGFSLLLPSGLRQPEMRDPDPLATRGDAERFRGDQRPVVNVSWNDAMAFCQRLRLRTGKNYTLPSEAQWEYARRAGTTTPFHFGETISSELANYDGREPYGGCPKGEIREQTTDVGVFPANAWGLYDMHGNVWEWCADHWHSNDEGAPDDGRPWIDENAKKDEFRLLRGGSWSVRPRVCRSVCRGYDFPGDRFDVLGFRVCCLPQD